MDKRSLANWRLRSQRLYGPPLQDAEAVVGWLGAVQSQEYELARWSLGARTRRVTAADVERLVAEGRILRTHILRPTWHFVLPADIRPMMALTGPRIAMGSERRFTQLGLSTKVRGRALDLIGAALAGGRRQTRPQLVAVLKEGGIDVSAGNLGFVLMHAELELLVCSGGLDGRQQTYALLDERAPPAAPFDRDEALAELTHRYFTGHGPSTIADFTWWSSLTVADARRGLAAVGTELDTMELEGTTYWFGEKPPASSPRSPAVHLLQAFDEYVVGYQRTRSLMDAAGLYGPGTWNPNTFMHPIVVDGQMAGGWRRVAKTGSLTIETRLMRQLDKAEEAALAAAVEQYGRFLGVPVTLG